MLLADTAGTSEGPADVQAQNIWQPVLVAEQSGYKTNKKNIKMIFLPLFQPSEVATTSSFVASWCITYTRLVTAGGRWSPLLDERICWHLTSSAWDERKTSARKSSQFARSRRRRLLSAGVLRTALWSVPTAFQTPTGWKKRFLMECVAAPPGCGWWVLVERHFGFVPVVCKQTDFVTVGDESVFDLLLESCHRH